MKKFLSILLLMGFLEQSLITKESLDNYDKTFLLPVDWSTEQHLNLSVNIPRNFKSIQPASSWDKAELIEFIPENENVGDWSEIITIQKLINKQISANQITAAILKKLSAITNISVISKENSNKKYEEDAFVIKYNYKGKDEVLGAKYLSGPYDSVGVQYTIRLNENLSQQKAVEKIQDFFKNNLVLLDDSK